MHWSQEVELTIASNNVLFIYIYVYMHQSQEVVLTIAFNNVLFIYIYIYMHWSQEVELTTAFNNVLFIYIYIYALVELESQLQYVNILVHNAQNLKNQRTLAIKCNQRVLFYETMCIKIMQLKFVLELQLLSIKFLLTKGNYKKNYNSHNK